MRGDGNILIVLSPKHSLANMERHGQLQRFLQHYVRRYKANGFRVGLLSFGERDCEERLAEGLFEDIVAPRRPRGWSWAIAGPVRHPRLCSRYPVWRAMQATGMMTLMLGRVGFRVGVVTTFGYDYEEFSRRAGHRVRSRLLRMLLRVGLRMMDSVIVTSSTVAGRAVRAGAPKDSLAVVSNAAPLADTIDGPRRPRSVLWVGRLHPQKRLDIALRAAQLAEARLTLVGNGELDENEARMLEEAGGRFIGAIPHDEVLALLDEHEVLLLTSAFEGTPKVVVEALARGAVALVPQLPELSWLFERRPTPVATFDRLDGDSAGSSLRALLDDAEKRRGLARSGYELAKSRFDISDVVDSECRLIATLGRRSQR